MDFAKRPEHRYSKARVAAAEQPLPRVAEAEGRKRLNTVWYDRGGWAFWMLMQTMGRTEMFSGLHAFIEKYRGNPDHPALHNLFETLRPHAKDAKAFDECIGQCFEAVTLPRFEIVSATKEANGAGFRVRGRLRNACMPVPGVSRSTWRRPPANVFRRRTQRRRSPIGRRGRTFLSLRTARRTS